MKFYNNKHTSAVWYLSLVSSCLTWGAYGFFVTASPYWTLVRFVAFFPLTMIVFACAFAVLAMWNTAREARNIPTTWRDKR